VIPDDDDDDDDDTVAVFENSKHYVCTSLLYKVMDLQRDAWLRVLHICIRAVSATRSE
jgi:hypothetical protein